MRHSGSQFALRWLSMVVALASLTTPSVSAEDHTPAGKYLLTDVSFELSDGGRGTPRSTFRVSGSGHGVFTEGAYALPDRTSEYAVNSKDVFHLLEICYRNRFFDLKSSYGPPKWPRLNSKGEIEVNFMVVADGGGRAITLRIGSFAKTVVYGDSSNPPPILIEIARAIDAMRSQPIAK